MIAAIASSSVIDATGSIFQTYGCELARRGVRVRVIDKLAQPTEQSRAIAVHARSLDMFERMGIVDEMLSTGIKANAMQMYTGHRKLLRVPLGDVDSTFPFTLTTAQTETERVLGEHLQSFGVVVERGVELVALSQDRQDGGAVQLTLQHEGGSTEQAGASWVIGADGGHSTVRRLVGTKLAGTFIGERSCSGTSMPSTGWIWTRCILSSPLMVRWWCCRCGPGGCVFLPRCMTRPALRRTCIRLKRNCRRSSISGLAASGCCARIG